MAEESHMYGVFVFVPVSVGFAAGAVFVYLADILLPILVSPHNMYVPLASAYHIYPLPISTLASSRR